MKLAEFFRQAIETIDFTIELLEQPVEPSEKNPVRILCIEPEEKLHRLTALFSAEPQPKHLTHYIVHIAHYLNLLIMDVAAPTEKKPEPPVSENSQEPQTQEPTPTSNKADFFFLPIDPITIVHNPECSPQLMIKYLGFIKAELQKREHNLLTGWQVNRSDNSLYFCNSASSIDWPVFLSCVKDPDPQSNENSIVFEGQNAEDTPVVCKITAEKYLQLHRVHGVSLIDNNRLFLGALQKVLNENPQEYLHQHRSFLQTQLQSKSPLQLAQFSESIARTGKASAQNGSVAFYETLDTISFIFLNTNKLLSQIPTAVSEKESSINDKTKSILVSVDDLSANFDEESRQVFIDCITELLNLLKTAQTLPALKEPYRHEDETLVSEILLNLNTVLNLINCLKQLIAKPDTPSNQANVCVQWLQEASLVLLYDIIESFSKTRYHAAIIQLTLTSIEFLEIVRSKADEDLVFRINQSLFRFKDNFINSLLITGQYSALIYWLNYFSQLLPLLYKKEHYDFHLQQANDHNYLALVFQHRSEYAQSRAHLNKGWECMLRVVNPIFLPLTSTDRDHYYECTKTTIESLALCYRALGTEEFEARNFHIARTLFEKGQDDKAREVIVKVRNIVLFPQGKVVSTKTSAPKKELTIDDVHINVHWCALFNFLSIRHWLSRNLEKPCSMITENGKLVLSFPKQNQTNTLSNQLKHKKVLHSKKDKEITLEEFEKIDLRAIKEALSAFYGQTKRDFVPDSSSAQQTRSVLQPSAILDNPLSEELELCNLKSMHYKSIHHYDDAYFLLVASSLEAFYLRCQDPLLKVRALSYLVSSLLARSLFLRTTQERLDDSDILLRKAKEFSKTGRQFAQEQFNDEKRTTNSEVSESLDTIDAKIVDHEMIMSEYLPMRELVNAQEILTTLHNAAKRQPEYCHSIRLGASKVLSNYNPIATLRNNLLRKPLCLRKETYKKRVEFIRELTLLSFELAYELFAQPALGNRETNNEKQALARAQEEYKILLELEVPMGIVFSDSIKSSILVIRSAIENDSAIETRLQLLDQAFKLVKNNVNTTQSALILLRKIDYIITQKIKNPFVMINGLLRDLFNFIKAIQSQRSLKNEYNFGYIAHEVCLFIDSSLSLDQASLMRFEASSLKKYLDLQLSILEYYQTTLLSRSELSSIEKLVKSLCEPAIVRVKNSLSILEAVLLEETVRQDLTQKTKKSQGLPFLIPKVLVSQLQLSDTSDDQQSFFSPCSPLIGLVVNCKEMLDYEPNKEELGALFNEKLNTVYKMVARNAVQSLDAFLPQTLIDLLKGEDKKGYCFTQLHQLFQAMNTAHSSNAPITAEVIPLIRQVLTLYPEQPYLNFTLYKALRDKTPKDTECPELVQACYKAADGGHSLAEYHYACLLQTGKYGTEKHEQAACIYLDRSRKAGYYKAEIRFAKLYKHGLFGLEQNKKYSKMHARLALDNSECPEHLASDIRREYDIIFIPQQIDM